MLVTRATGLVPAARFLWRKTFFIGDLSRGAVGVSPVGLVALRELRLGPKLISAHQHSSEPLNTTLCGLLRLIHVCPLNDRHERVLYIYVG